MQVVFMTIQNMSLFMVLRQLFFEVYLVDYQLFKLFAKKNIKEFIKGESFFEFILTHWESDVCSVKLLSFHFACLSKLL